MIEKESQEELRIGYAPSPTAVIISRVLSQYHELSPGGRLTLHDLTHTEMLSGLKAGKLTVRLSVGFFNETREKAGAPAEKTL